MQIKLEIDGAVYGARFEDNADPKWVAELVQNTIVTHYGTDHRLPQVDEQELDTND